MQKLTLFLLVILTASVVIGEDFSSVDDLVEKQLGRPTIYSPWREAYGNENYHQQNQKDVVKECVFCAQVASGNDERYFILHRFKYHVVMFNAFPVAKGQLLIVPYAHVPGLSDLSKEAQEELIYIVTFSIEVLKDVLKIEGVNFGANIGRLSGASIPDHMHVHIVPRKLHERAFIHIIGGLTTIGWDMQKLYSEIKEGFDKLLYKQ